VAIAVFWWLFVAGTLTAQLVLISWFQARRAPRATTARDPVAAVRPIRPFTLAAVAVGGHLAMFSWLIALAWRFGDRTGAMLTTGIMVVLGVLAYVRGRKATGATLGRVAGGHVSLMGIVILLLLNLRTNVWVATSYGISVAEARAVLPTWIVPVLTLALVVWVALVVAVTQRGRPSPNSQAT
jgi:hypothetical protein